MRPWSYISVPALWRLTVHGRVKPEDPRNRRFEFQKRSQLFIRVHNETLSVAAMCVSNPDRSPFTIHG
jgi:hypothetical protein